ncbi:hypothetical protein K435DRAFT_775542 [Dendrothele bispora CBS 962.96]|uniref:Hydrophobin n=1 Tax=Dendrothele bispora (strain CBS 962.96) TaxID=1314807 RepID=A0A4S8MIK2_DENBC|nr:hypothetical protein K435DRAFT_775542 [Dendrothele bispora CBS 962.96]
MFKYFSAILILALAAPAVIQAAPQTSGATCNPNLTDQCPSGQLCCNNSGTFHCQPSAFFCRVD